VAALTGVRLRLDVVVGLIQAHRYTWHSERELCDHLERLFLDVPLPVQREERLSPTERPDFLIGDVVVEVKVAGSFETALRQLRRYNDLPGVAGIVLATTVARHHFTPEQEAEALTWAKPLHIARVRAK
jgi:hypothetical protein